MPRATDIFCIVHERFLPLVDQTSRVRALLVAIIVLVICAGFAGTAESGSPVWVWLVYTAAGLAAVALPVRHFRTGGPAAAVAWVVLACVSLLMIHVGADGRATPGTVLFIAIPVALTLHSATGTLAAEFEPEDGGPGAGESYTYSAADGWKVEVQDEGCVEITRYAVSPPPPSLVIPWHRIWQISSLK